MQTLRMKGIKNLWLSTLVALLPVACSDDIEQATGSSEPLPIRLTVAKPSQTRGAADPHLMENTLPDGTKVQLKINGKHYNYQFDAAQDELICLNDTAPFFPFDNSSVSVQAFHPVTDKNPFAWNTCWWYLATNCYTNADYIAHDHMFGKPLAGWQGLDSSGKVKPTTDKIPLQFDHVMAKILVNVSVTDTKTSKIKRVFLTNIKDQLCYDFINCRLDSVKNVAKYGYQDIFYDNSGVRSSITCCGLIPPQTIGTDKYFIIAHLSDGGKLYYKLPQATTFVSGRVYTYNIGTAVTGTNDMITLSDTLFTYNTSAQGPTITLKWGTTTLTQGTDYDFDTSSQNTATNAGTYTVKVNFKGRYSGTAQKTWKINRINPTYTAPSTYRIDTAPTTAQNLVKAGSCSISGCTVQYSLGTASAAGTSWSSTVPQKTVAGEYYVWWRIYSTNGNYHTLNGTSPLLARIRKAPGQVICSDGTICEYSQRGSKTPVAVVVRWGSDTGNSKYTRGLAMALKDAGSGSKLKWSTEQVLRNSVQFTSGEPVDNEYGGSYNGSPYNTSTYPAFQKALAYSPAAPSNTSGWFLPSAWQFNEVIWGMGTDSETRYNNLRQFFSSRGGTDMNDNSDYWTTSESGKDNAIRFVFNGAGKAGYWGTIVKTSTCYVRPMLAF